MLLSNEEVDKYIKQRSDLKCRWGSRVLLCVINLFYSFRFFCKCACCTALRKIPRLLCSSFRTLCRRYAAQRRLRRAVAVPASHTITKNRPQGSVSCYGGGSWIRTSEVSDNRFTVCPLWPLGNSPI